jgi:hypothetical protein
VLDADGKPVEGARVESGDTHLTLTDREGKYTLRSLIDGPRKVIVKVHGQQFEPRTVVMAGKNVAAVDFECK